jgi:D-alanine-D-alanine ligase
MLCYKVIMKKNIKIAVLYSEATKTYVDSPFFAAEEDTKLSAIQICETLKRAGARAFVVPLIAKKIESTIDEIDADCIFNCIEWSGRDIPYALLAMGCLERKGTPFTGATSNNYHLVADKKLMKHAFDLANIPTARWQPFIYGNERVRNDFHFPVIVKPALEHCSMGLSRDMVLHEQSKITGAVKKQMKRFSGSVFVEEFIKGREFHVAVIERNGKAVVLPPVEITFNVTGDKAFLTYEARWEVDHPDYQMSDIGVSTLPKGLKTKIEKVCTDIFEKLEYRDYMRVDMRVRDGKIFVLEANCNPGLGDDDESAIPLAFRAAGMNFTQYLEGIVDSCMKRFGKK